MSQPKLAFLVTHGNIDETWENFDREIDAKLLSFVASQGEFPKSMDFDGVVISGSGASAYHRDDWILQLKAWVAEALTTDLPILGVCYGHQILADVVGGHIKPMDGFEIGYRDVHQSRSSPIFEGISETFTTFTSHSDRVVSLPDGVPVIAENDFGIQAFEMEGNVYGTQFHPEFNTETALAAINRPSKDLAPEVKQTALDSVNDENYQTARESAKIFDNFLSLLA